MVLGFGMVQLRWVEGRQAGRGWVALCLQLAFGADGGGSGGEMEVLVMVRLAKRADVGDGWRSVRRGYYGKTMVIVLVVVV